MKKCTFFFKKVNDLFVSRPRTIHAKTAESPLSKSPPPSKKNVPNKFDSWSTWGCITTFPCKLRPQFFLRAALWGAREPSAPPGYVYVWND